MSSTNTTETSESEAAVSDFESWARSNELSQETLKMLSDNGFTSVKSCARLTSSVVQKHFSKSLPMAQALLLEGAVDELRMKTPGRPASVSEPTQACTPSTSRSRDNPAVTDHHEAPPTVNATSGQSRAAAAAAAAAALPGPGGLDYSRLAELFTSADESAVGQQEDSSHTDGKPQIFDPFQFYGSSHSGATGGTPSKVRDIRDYVLFNTHPQNDKHSNSFKVGEVAVTLGLNEKKPSLDKISPLQYMEASMRILREMVLQDKISMNGVLQYTGYVTKIASMAQVFQWPAILKYDAEYRKQQGGMGFAWGADSPFLMHLFLSQDSEKHSSRPSGDTSRGDARNRYDPSTGKIVCERFNGRAGCRSTNCRYAHVCLVCFRTSHGSSNHRRQAPGQGSNQTAENNQSHSFDLPKNSLPNTGQPGPPLQTRSTSGSRSSPMIQTGSSY